LGTPLETLYNRFQTKVDEDLTGKESLIFALVDVAISKSYKNCNHDLTYALTDSDAETQTYDGSFDETLDNDEIELLALWMLYEWNRREQQRLIKLKDDIGTSDFNKLPNKVDKLKIVNSTMRLIMEDINDLKNDMNSYA